ncbi:hypothetical protein GCM10010278_57320 [Streptomyces melanogenes]|nr:hypothetical protein GCM10010278_57320 [Streptomyces melanogenes]
MPCTPFGVGTPDPGRAVGMGYGRGPVLARQRRKDGRHRVGPYRAAVRRAWRGGGAPPFPTAAPVHVDQGSCGRGRKFLELAEARQQHSCCDSVRDHDEQDQSAIKEGVFGVVPQPGE